MRVFSAVILALGCLGLTNAAALPKIGQESASPAHSVWSNKVSGRAPGNSVCAKTPLLCTECAKAKITLTKGRKACVPAKGKTCPPSPAKPAPAPQKPKTAKPPSKPTGGCIPKKGTQCKRETEDATIDEISDAGEAELARRADFVVPMDTIKIGSWDAGDIIKSNQFSACTFVAIYDRDQYVATHIPPGSLTQPELSESDIIAAYLTKIKTALKKDPLSSTKAGYFFYRADLSAANQKAIKDMFAAYGVVARAKSYTYQSGTRGYQIEVSRALEQLTFGPAIKEDLMP